MNKPPIPLLLVLLLSAAGHGQPASPSDPFLDALKKREAAVKAADITFRLKEVIAVDNDRVLESTNRFVIQGGMMRFEGAHPARFAQVIPHQWVEVSDGRVVKTLEQFKGTKLHVQCRIVSAEKKMWMGPQYVAPVCVAYRGLNRNWTQYPPELFKATSARRQINGAECVEYERLWNEHHRTALFVDPLKDHNIIRIVHEVRGKLDRQADISYARNEVCEWAPESWVELFYSSSGKLNRRWEVRVVSSKFNEPLPEDQFDIVFPPGVEVWDAVKQEYYLVQADGTLQPHPQYGKERPSPASQQEPPRYPPYMWWVLGGAGAFLFVIARVRRRALRRSRP